MTEITNAELKILGIQIIFMAIILPFMFLYASSPITAPSNIPTSVTNASVIKASDGGSWISNLISLPPGMGDLGIVVGLTTGVFITFDAFIALRFVADLVKGII